MASLAKVQASLVSPEVNLALANLNFDFSLFKVAAPVEYNQLGVALSHKRRKSAEEGSPHITARKLGSLFASILPKTPRLIKAYGLRASEITKSPKVNPKGDKTYGAFEDYVGIDGTTIWAAATSGPEAIAVHLLACILARQFPAAEATAIWHELVAERRKHLADSAQAGFFHDALAAPLSVSSENLSEWDAGARAWLRAADGAEPTKRRQIQLMLILDNISVPVNNDYRVYDSVTRAWTSALIAMDEMIGGSPYSIQDGAVVLALSAWHIYPDMTVFGKNYSKKVDQEDELVHPGGVLTLGLESKGDKDRGVSWSLALAHLRFYGDPVLCKHRLTSDSARLSMDQLLQVALGSLFHSWGVTMANVERAAKLITLMDSCCQKSFQCNHQGAINNEKINPCKLVWMRLLGKTAAKFLSADDDKELYRKLIGLGLRRRPLLTTEDSPCAGIWRLDTCYLVSLMRNEEDKVDFIREVALQSNIDLHSLVVRVQHCPSIITSSDPEASPMDWVFHYPGNDVHPDLFRFSFRTAVAPKASADCRFQRWELIGVDQQITERTAPSMPAAVMERNELCLQIGPESINTAKDGLSFEWIDPPSYYKSLEPQAFYRSPTSLAAQTCDCDIAIRDIPSFCQDEPSARTEDHPRKKSPRIEHTSKCCSRSRGRFEFLAGDPRTAALFLREGASKVRSLKGTIKLDHIIMCFEKGRIDPYLFQKHLTSMTLNAVRPAITHRTLEDISQTRTELATQYEVVSSLQALSRACDLYQDLPAATVSPNITTSGIALAKAKWVEDPKDGDHDLHCLHQAIGKEDPLSGHWRCSGRFQLRMSQMFACITMFESGVFDFHPDEFNEVIAISSGDSIYVCEQILTWPTRQYQLDDRVRRVVGNVGRPGLSFLIPPRDPRMRDIDPDTWKLVTHAKFDGIQKDCFQETSLHLGFSGYCMPKTTGKHRGAYIEASYVETLISVHDGGRWIADLSPVREDEDPPEYVCPTNDSDHDHWEETPWELIPDLISIDTWDELLERPAGPVAFRAVNNWQACLAATLISNRLGKTPIVCDVWCQKCILQNLDALVEQGIIKEKDLNIHLLSSRFSNGENNDADDDHLENSIQRNPVNGALFIMLARPQSETTYGQLCSRFITRDTLSLWLAETRYA